MNYQQVIYSNNLKHILGKCIEDKKCDKGFNSHATAYNCYMKKRYNYIPFSRPFVTVYLALANYLGNEAETKI